MRCQWLFAVISAIAFTTVLGTVSGLILASAGAVSHDLISCFRSEPLDDAAQVRIAKIASCGVGAIAIVLGIVFQQMNVSYLVGWAFSVAASANLPALVNKIMKGQFAPIRGNYTPLFKQLAARATIRANCPNR